MLVRLRARDEYHLRDLLLNRIWQIEAIQQTKTFITIAQMKPKNTAEELLTAMIHDVPQQRTASAPMTNSIKVPAALATDRS